MWLWRLIHFCFWPSSPPTECGGGGGRAVGRRCYGTWRCPSARCRLRDWSGRDNASITDNGGAAGGQRGGWGRMAAHRRQTMEFSASHIGRTVASQARAAANKRSPSSFFQTTSTSKKYISRKTTDSAMPATRSKGKIPPSPVPPTVKRKAKRATVGSKAAPEASVERAVARPRRKAAAPATTRQLRPRAGAPRSPSMDSSASRPPRTPAAGRSRSATPFPAHDLDPDADALFGDIDGDKEDNEEEMDLDELVNTPPPRTESVGARSRSHSPTPRGRPRSRTPRAGDRRGAVTSPERGRYKPDRPQILDSDDSEPEDDYEETEKRKERDRRQKVSPHP
ncbi:hypothetical protein DFH06DRAFT_1150452 [Mycena polygramma]|nr:hypothetical protein DFH06DRAFT_1150452 [Mycena polygramma]